MKKLLTALVALLTLIALSGLGTPAAAAPGMRVSARLSIDSTCAATIYLSWSGITPPKDISIHLTGMTDDTFILPYSYPVETAKGSDVLYTQGVVRAAGRQQNKLFAELSGGWQVTDTSYKNAACSWS